MATYRSIADSETDPKAPVTSELMKALALNPIAIMEGQSGAPVVEGAWHPYNAVTVGDGNNGLIYDHGVDGNVSSVETPDFEDGYEYRVVGVDLRLAEGGFPGTIFDVDFDLYKGTDAAYQTVLQRDLSGGGFFSLDITIASPKIAARQHFVSVRGGAWSGGTLTDSTVQEMLRARLNPQGTNIDAGKMYMLRRRIYFDV